MGDLLLQRYGYSPSGGSSNRMEYAGLVEGLHWAKLVHTTKIIVRGDSNLVIKQITGEYQVKIQCCNGIARISSNLSRTQINLAKRLYFNTFVVRTTRLQNMGTSLKENAVAVNWENCNRLCLGV